jgi:transcription elongation factor Elf1
VTGPSAPVPSLSRTFVCPDCKQTLALDYGVSRDPEPAPAMFECPACKSGHMVDLPGTLKRVRKA